MKNTLFTLFTTIFAANGFGQLYYNLGLKTQRVGFTNIYEGTGEYVYNYETGGYALDMGDTTRTRFVAFGPEISYGYNFPVSDKIDVGAEIDAYAGILTISSSGFYFDFAAAGRVSYLLKNKSLDNVYFRMGVGYGMNRGYSENDVVGINLRAGYEYDMDGYVLGAALTGNLFFEDLSYYASVNQDRLIGRKLNAIGVALYFSLGKE